MVILLLSLDHKAHWVNLGHRNSQPSLHRAVIRIKLEEDTMCGALNVITLLRIFFCILGSGEQATLALVLCSHVPE